MHGGRKYSNGVFFSAVSVFMLQWRHASREIYKRLSSLCGLQYCCCTLEYIIKTVN